MNKFFIKSVIISSIILIVSLLLTIKMIGIASYFVTSAKTSFVILGKKINKELEEKIKKIK